MASPYLRARRFAVERLFVADFRRAAPARFAGALAFDLALRTVFVAFFFIALAIVLSPLSL
jgi:hypothetical protein